MRLKDEVGLAGEPEACVLEMGQHRFGAVVGEHGGGVEGERVWVGLLGEQRRHRSNHRCQCEQEREVEAYGFEPKAHARLLKALSSSRTNSSSKVTRNVRSLQRVTRAMDRITLVVNGQDFLSVQSHLYERFISPR